MNNLPDDYLNIDTPENVAFGYEVAGIGSRFLAALIDTLLIFVLQLIVNLTLLLLATTLFDQTLSNNRAFIWMAAVFGLIAFAFFWGYYIFFEMAWNGQSPGKRWVGLRVICTNGTPVTLAESIIRNLIRLVDFLPVYYGIGVVTMFVNAQSRRLGDLAAGTLVVRDRGPVTLESLAAAATLPTSYPPDQGATPDLPAERLSYQDLQIAEEFLRRRFELTNRADLAQQLAQTLRQRLDLPAQSLSSEEAEKFIIELVQAQHKRTSGSGK